MSRSSTSALTIKKNKNLERIKARTSTSGSKDFARVSAGGTILDFVAPAELKKGSIIYLFF